MLTIGSWFTGYGGLDMAARIVLAYLGFSSRVVWHSDIKPAAVALLAHRHPEVPNLGDIATLTDVPPADVWTFGWPCQPHSSAGKRLGKDDHRALWPDVARLVALHRPAVLLGENVDRVASNGELARVVRSLAGLGYVGSWRCVRASDRGACHRRKRLFLGAVRADVGGSGLRGLGGGPGGLGAGPVAAVGAPRGDAAPLTLLPTPLAKLGAARGTPSAATAQARMDAGRRNLDDAIALLPTPLRRDSRQGAGYVDREGRPLSETIHRVAEPGPNRWGKYAAAIARHGQTLGRPAPEPVQVGLRTGRPQLAPAFVEWMMMLPEGHVTGVPGELLARRPDGVRGAMLSMLGDGVVPAQAAYAYASLLPGLLARAAAATA